jgi:hypothetical protein
VCEQLLDHLVGAAESRRHIEAECFRSLNVDGQSDQDAIDIRCSASVLIDHFGTAAQDQKISPAFWHGVEGRTRFATLWLPDMGLNPSHCLLVCAGAYSPAISFHRLLHEFILLVTVGALSSREPQPLCNNRFAGILL